MHSHTPGLLILLQILTLLEAEEQDLAHEANYALIQEHWRITGSERVLIPLSGDSYVALSGRRQVEMVQREREAVR